MTGRVDQVNQELVTCQAISVNRTSCSDSKSKLTLGLLLDLSNIILVKGEVHRDGSGLDGDTTINLVLTILFVSILPFFFPSEQIITYRVSVNRISPALEEAMIPALETRESVRVDFPWSTCAMTDMFRMLVGLSVAHFR